MSKNVITLAFICFLALGCAFWRASFAMPNTSANVFLQTAPSNRQEQAHKLTGKSHIRQEPLAQEQGLLAPGQSFPGVRSFGQGQSLSEHAKGAPCPAPSLISKPQHIVTLAPSITETTFALGAGEQVVGVTSYCTYPPAAAVKAKVAGFSEVNYEALIKLRPDLVILPQDKLQNAQRLRQLGLNVLTVNILSIEGLRQSICQIGAATGNPEAAAALLHDIDVKLQNVQKAVGSAGALSNKTTGSEYTPGPATSSAFTTKRPRVLFSVMQTFQAPNNISEVYIIGQDGFFSQLIKLAGAENAYSGSLAFPRISREAISYLNPDIIIDVMRPGSNKAELQAAWFAMKELNAIKNNKLFIFEDESITVPGPRFIETLLVLTRLFHPELPELLELPEQGVQPGTEQDAEQGTKLTKQSGAPSAIDTTSPASELQNVPLETVWCRKLSTGKRAEAAQTILSKPAQAQTYFYTISACRLLPEQTHA